MITNEEAYEALHLLNSGLWVQLEGSTGRYIANLRESGLFVVDRKATEDKGPTVIRDGYGQMHAQPIFKIDLDVLEEMQDIY